MVEKRKMMVMMRSEINEFENNLKRERTTKTQNQFFQKNKINQYLMRLTGKMREGTENQL